MGNTPFCPLFFFAESRVQTECSGDHLVPASSSKLKSVIFQLLGEDGADDLPFEMDVGVTIEDIEVGYCAAGFINELLLLDLLCIATGFSFRSRRPCYLAGCFIERDGIADHLSIFRCEGNGFYDEINSFWLLYVSHIYFGLKL